MTSFFKQKEVSDKKKKDKAAERKARWLPFQRYWILYTALLGTAILSAFAGLYIGLAPEADGTVQLVNSFDGFRRIFFALFYMIGFVVNAEGATLFWETKLVYHDVNEKGETNETQIRTAKLALGVSIFAVLVTGLSAAYFITAWLGSLDDFKTIPLAAQTWVVWSVPILLLFNAVSAIFYWYNSAEAELERWKDQIRRTTQAQMAQLEADTYKDVYIARAPELARKRGEALARKAARQDFFMQEIEEGEDLDGDGFVGSPQDDSKNQKPGKSATVDVEAFLRPEVGVTPPIQLPTPELATNEPANEEPLPPKEDPELPIDSF